MLGDLLPLPGLGVQLALGIDLERPVEEAPEIAELVLAVQIDPGPLDLPHDVGTPLAEPSQMPAQIFSALRIKDHGSPAPSRSPKMEPHHPFPQANPRNTEDSSVFGPSVPPHPAGEEFSRTVLCPFADPPYSTSSTEWIRTLPSLARAVSQ